MGVQWDYFNKFDGISDKYLPIKGEGSTKATQIVTAVSKLVYKWYNDGDVFDNTYHLEGWWNDLSSYANWLYHHTTEEVQEILNGIKNCYTDSDYENLLKELADKLCDTEYLAKQNEFEKEFSIYDYDGKFKFVELNEEDYDEDEEDY